MRKLLVAVVALTLASLSIAGTAQAQDVQLGTVTAEPATVPEAGEYTFAATGEGFIADTDILLLPCVSPAAELVPGEADFDTVVAAGGAISPLEDCDVAAAQTVTVDGDGNWTGEITAEVGANFFLLAGDVAGTQGGGAWVPIGDASALGGDADADLAETGVETGLLAVIGTAVLGAGVLVTRESKRFRS